MKLLQRLFSRKPKPEEEIAALIEGFANGAASRWDWIEGFANSTGRDWAYFISTHFESEPIDWAQEECFKVEEEFPSSTGPVGWCNEQGLERLRAIASELRSAATELHSSQRCLRLWRMRLVNMMTVGSVAVGLLAAISTCHPKPPVSPLTLSPEELRIRPVSPYYSGLPIGSGYPATKDASVKVKRNAAYDVKRCTPKVLSLSKTPAEIHFREGEKPTGLIPVVAFQILESGEVANIVLKQSSGIRDKDNAALDWVKGTTYNNRPGCGTVETEVGVTIDLAAP
jgi:hypothetical protein